jgi:hypothetical protein
MSFWKPSPIETIRFRRTRQDRTTQDMARPPKAGIGLIREALKYSRWLPAFFGVHPLSGCAMSIRFYYWKGSNHDQR